MEKKSFLKTEVGRLGIAGIIVLLAFPVICLGINIEQLSVFMYLGLAMIAGGMAAAPIYTFFIKKED